MSQETKQLNARIPADLKEKLDEFIDDNGLQQQDAVEMALRTMLLDKAAAMHPDSSANIKAVRDALQIVIDHYMSAVNASAEASAMAEEKIRMAMQKSANQVETLSAEVTVLRNRAEQDSKALAEAQRDLSLAIQARKNAEEQISFLQDQNSELRKKIQELDALKRSNADLMKSLAAAQEERLAAFKRLADLSTEYLQSADTIRNEAAAYQARCAQLEKVLTEAGISLPDSPVE